MHAYTFLGLGIGHERCGIPCQDVVGVSETPGGMAVVLSDGASAAAFATDGAEETVGAILDIFRQEVPGVHLRDWVTPEKLLFALRERLIRRARGLECSDLSQLSATAMFAAVADSELVVGNLGDGMLFVLDADGKVLLQIGNVLTPGCKPAFGIDEDAPRHLQWGSFDVENDRVALVLMTSDGCGEMLQNRGQGDPAETVRELFRYIRDGQLASSEDLADVLDQMAEVTTEREDDWSVAVLNLMREDSDYGKPGRPISMLSQEKCKYLSQTSCERVEVF